MITYDKYELSGFEQSTLSDFSSILSQYIEHFKPN